MLAETFWLTNFQGVLYMVTVHQGACDVPSPSYCSQRP